MNKFKYFLDNIHSVNYPDTNLSKFQLKTEKRLYLRNFYNKLNGIMDVSISEEEESSIEDEFDVNAVNSGTYDELIYLVQWLINNVETPNIDNIEYDFKSFNLFYKVFILEILRIVEIPFEINRHNRIDEFMLIAYCVRTYTINDDDLNRAVDIINWCNYFTSPVGIYTSNIPNAGFGLFAKYDIPDDTIITDYGGKLYNSIDFEKYGDQSSEYILTLYSDNVLDASREFLLGDLGRWANSMINESDNNTKFDEYEDDEQVALTTTRKIQQYEEIYVDYGKTYRESLRKEFANCLVCGQIATLKEATNFKHTYCGIECQIKYYKESF